MCLCINRNARPNKNQLITYYQRVSYLLKNTTVPCEKYLQYNLETCNFYLFGHLVLVFHTCPVHERRLIPNESKRQKINLTGIVQYIELVNSVETRAPKC